MYLLCYSAIPCSLFHIQPYHTTSPLLCPRPSIVVYSGVFQSQEGLQTRPRARWLPWEIYGSAGQKGTEWVRECVLSQVRALYVSMV